MTVVGEPITVTLHLGGMRGSRGSISRESFDRRRRITMHALVEEDSLPLYADSRDACIELGEQLGELLHRYLEHDAS